MGERFKSCRSQDTRVAKTILYRYVSKQLMYQVLNVLILMKIDYKIKSCTQTDMCKYCLLVNLIT